MLALFGLTIISSNLSGSIVILDQIVVVVILLSATSI